MAKTKAKKSSPKTTVEIVVKNDASLASAMEPEKEGSKYMVQNNWISESQVLKMLQRTPKEHVYTRPGKGGKTFSYVTGTYVKKVLNFVFGWNWDFEVLSHEVIKSERGDQIVVLGKLTVKDDKGHNIVKSQWGRAEVKYFKDSVDPVDFGNDLKAATTDALKKCASELGIASDIYGMNEFKEVDIEKKKESKKLDNEVVIDCDGNCGAVVSPQVASYSKKMFNGKIYCRDCQAINKKGGTK